MGDILIHPTLQIGKLALDGILADTAAAYLVGDEDEGGFLGSETVELGFDGLQRVVYLGGLEEEVREPERDAVDDDDAARDIVMAEVFLFLDVRPLRTATRLMTAHPLTELFIPHMGGGQIDRIRRKAQGQALGLATLA